MAAKKATGKPTFAELLREFEQAIIAEYEAGSCVHPNSRWRCEKRLNDARNELLIWAERRS